MEENDRQDIRAHRAVVIMSPKMCNFCEAEAVYDTKTVIGPWANVCQEHYDIVGVGVLGMGLGQRYIVKEG